MEQQEITPTYPDYHNKPFTLSNEEIANPFLALQDVFGYTYLREFRTILKEMYKDAIQQDDVDAHNYYIHCNCLEKLLEAAHVLYERRKAFGQEPAEVMEQFLGVLAHEIKNQLNAIQLYNSWMEGDVKDKEKAFAEYFPLIKATTAHALNVLNNMSTTVKYRTGQLDFSVNFETVNLDKLLGDATAPFLIMAKAQDRELCINTRKALNVSFSTDPIKLKQILTNLLHNAFAYSPPGTKVTLTAFTNDTTTLGLTITNAGKVSNKHLEALKRPFSVIDSGLAGAGTGLYISKLYTKLLGGYITGEATILDYTHFMLRFPNSIQVK